MTLITIIPFENILEVLINKIKNKIKEKFNTNIVVIKNQPIPITKKRGPQLLADDFLPIINKLKKDYGLGITSYDLYVPELNFVFGVALGKNCVISIARLEGDKLVERSIKESVHELGHCFGLRHCSNVRCVMHFSNSLFDTDYKEENFCEKCKNKLNQK